MTDLSREQVMRITIHATIENADNSSAPQLFQIGEVTRDARVDPASGLGLFVREANALLRQIQSVVLTSRRTSSSESLWAATIQAPASPLARS